MGLTPWTRRILIIVVGVAIIASMFTGYFEAVLNAVVKLWGQSA